MKAKDRVHIGQPNNATCKYETLRANALGDINRAMEFTVFLRKGMCGWFRSLQEQGTWLQKREVISPVVVEFDAGFVAILADAILKSACLADCWG